MATHLPERWCRNCGSYVVSDEAGGYVHLSSNKHLCHKPIRGAGKTAEPYDRTPIVYKEGLDAEAGVPRHQDDGPEPA